MKKSKLLKITTILGLTLVMISMVANIAFAANEEEEEEDTPTSWNDVDWEDVTSEDEDEEKEEDKDKKPANDILEETNTNKDKVEVENKVEEKTDKDVDSLAHTGIEDFGGVVAIASVAGLIVAIYSYKKITEYNNI